MKDSFDIIVIGGGSIGLAAAHYASREGRKVLVLERFGYFNDKGASSGAERQFRIQYNEKEISQWVLDSIPLWEELQSEYSVELLKTVGCLWFGNPKVTGAEGQIEAVTRVMRELNVPYEALGVREIEDRFGFNELPPAYSGFFQRHGAAIHVQATLKTLHRSCTESGRVTLKSRITVRRLESNPDGVTVETDQGVYHGARLVVTAGPYVNEVLSLLGVQLDLVIWEMVGAYFRQIDPAVKFPTWISFDEKSGDDPMLYYGFPETDWAHSGHYVRVAANYPVRTFRDVREYKQAAEPQCVKKISNWVKRHMKGLDPKPHFASACMCALVTEPENEWVLRREIIMDFAPEAVPHHRNVVVCASGWNYKIVPLLGKICTDLALRGVSPYDLSKLRLAEDVMAQSAR
ncbi:FAD-dependent oxidoreductase [Stigmatella aurantiaca]|uniref:FAD dependent oxidoreductase n=1 Tax=Stigmatella aurantiaca (strain DW4/3-1) TaxID=378806 RepID=Q08TD8_STIAD|nr:FAD-dependent oxidoreductase [Stigmatella aurantiaca]ADO68404.1 FAD dependent oxidoreductase [Stigmatella aurantiaca DW4/3-1]EAU63752.1 FAD dependent oxidoreductase [Stigmatella aurantiaca DW4/3-1]